MTVTKKTFGVMLKNLLDRYKIKQKDLADECGIATSTINKILNSGRESDFETILTLIRTIVDHDRHLQEEKLMTSYMLQIQNPSNFKPSMEYCDTHDMRETLKSLCEKADSKADHQNKLKEYVKMYELNLQRKDQQFERNFPDELFNKVVSQNNKSEEMQIFQSIIRLSMFQQEMNFHKIIDLIPALETQLKKSNSNIQSSLKMRFNQLLQTVYLRNICDFEKARELAQEALDLSIGKRYDAASYVNLGDSFIHDDLDKATGYITKSIEIYKELGMDFAVEMMRDKIDFISILRGKKLEFIQNDRNIALYYILNGQKEKGLKILAKLDKTAEALYIKGIATDDPDCFWDSLEGYMHRGDRLYGLFTVQELKRIGEREKVVDMFYNYNLRGGRPA